jgi:hypothetical protein
MLGCVLSGKVNEMGMNKKKYDDMIKLSEKRTKMLQATHNNRQLPTEHNIIY